MSILFQGRLRGAMTNDTQLAVKDVEIHSDGSLRFTDSLGRARVIPSVSGNLAILLRDVFTADGSVGEQQGPTMRWFV